MSSESLPSIEDLSTTGMLHVEQQCNHFEDAWKAWRSRPRPVLEDHLGDVTGPAAGVLFCELLHLELAYRRQHGEMPALEDYLPRFPDRERLLRGVFDDEGPEEAAPPQTPAPTCDLEATGAYQPAAEGGSSPGPPQVPGYTIEGELGRGAMGVVYKARQGKLDRVVALKMILAGGHASAQELARFLTEAKAVARLQHPHIVQIHEVGEHNGLSFFSMEFCAGGSLADHLDGTPLPPNQAARLVEALARAAQAAHNRELIHRDLKPANILLAARDGAADAARPELASPTFWERWTPKLADFGLARDLQTSGKTASGAIVGTPSYMAPEQADGRTKQVGPAADVYALGVILYECLTGRPPFRAATLLETLEQVRTQEPVPVRRLQPRTPRDLEIVCLKCLEKDARDRYPSAEALADDLSRYRRGEPIRELPGVWDWLRHALRTRPPPPASYSWITLVWYGLICLLVHAAIFGLVQAGQPVGWVWAALVANWAGQVLVTWWYQVRRLRWIPERERHSVMISVGYLLGTIGLALAFVPWSGDAPAREALGLYPALAGVSGTQLFGLAPTHWSRFYLMGLGMIALVPVMALWPDAAPLLYGATFAACLWYWAYSIVVTFRCPAVS
jgi:serine/threonine protein kinase